MARLLGVDLPRNKRIKYALTAIYGIGIARSEEILEKAGLMVMIITHLLKLILFNKVSFNCLSVTCV